MNKFIPIIISLMMFSNTSCRQNDDVQVAENNTEDNLYRVVNIDEYIAPNAGKYIETYIPTDFVVEVSAHKATILRGNIENVVVGEYSYKLSGETHAILPLILIRNIKTKS